MHGLEKDVVHYIANVDVACHPSRFLYSLEVYKTFSRLELSELMKQRIDIHVKALIDREADIIESI